jgi:hypothetical protein
MRAESQLLSSQIVDEFCRYMFDSFITHYFSSIVIKEFTKARIVKNNTINLWRCFVSWVNLPANMRIEWFRMESVIHKATPVERLGTVYFLVCFFEFSDNRFIVPSLLIAETRKATFVSQKR